MHSLLEIFQNEVLICALTSWFIAQVLKIPTYRIVEKEWNWRRFFGSGGMPSSHTSFVVALTLMIGFTSGFRHRWFCHFLHAFVHCDVRRDGRAAGNWQSGAGH